MKVSLWKSLGLGVCCALALVTSAVAAEEDASQDDVARRTERALFKMSQVDTGTKKVRIVTPAKPVAAQAPLVEPPTEMEEDAEAAPMPQEDPGFSQDSAGVHNPTLLDDCSCGECENCCEDLCCDCLCGPPGHCWVRAEVLGWWTKGQNAPPLVTAGVDQNNPGILGEPGTQILFGGDDISDKARIGGRISAGTWLDSCHVWGIEGDYFMLDDLDQNFFTSGHTYPFLSRPFYDVTPGLPADGEAVEGVNNEDLCGQITVLTKSGFQGGGLALRKNLCCNTSCCDKGGSNPDDWNNWSANCCRLDGTVGYRYYRLDDSVYIREQLMSIATGNVPVAFGTTYDIFDSFRSRNEFNGAELGLVGTMYRGRWSLEGTAKVGLGNTRTTVTIDGATTTTVPGQPSNTETGGLLALDSNIGTYRQDSFSAIPQLGVKVGYQCGCHMRLLLGYDFIYWDNVARAAEQIDTNVDTNQLPPPIASGDSPAFRWVENSFWAQGVSAGVELRW
jgi:hypothetical protein